MDNNKLICPVKRINRTNVDFKIDLQDNEMNIKVDVTTKNIIKSAIDYIINKFNGGKENE